MYNQLKRNFICMNCISLIIHIFYKSRINKFLNIIIQILYKKKKILVNALVLD